jgi:hypothetical protein
MTADGSTPDRFTETMEQLRPEDRELLERALVARGRVLFDLDGELVGTIAGVLMDRETGRPTWFAVARAARVQNLVGVPVAGFEPFGSHYRTPATAAQIESAPGVSMVGLKAATERELCHHYGVPFTRGAARPGERRATSSRAFQEPGDGDGVGWLPAPRD